MVYPGDAEVVVELANGPVLCPDLTANDTSCTVTLPRDVYNITITQSNDIGSTVDSANFDSKWHGYSILKLVTFSCTSVKILVLEEELIEPGTLSVMVTVNSACPEAEYPALVILGPRSVGAAGQENGLLSPGDMITFSVESNCSPHDDFICYWMHPVVSELGIDGTSTTGDGYSGQDCPMVESMSNKNITPEVVAGITLAATLLVVLPVGVVLGCCGSWCLLRCRNNKKKKRANASPLYEEPVKPSGFSLTENQAYGHVTLQQRTN